MVLNDGTGRIRARRLLTLGESESDRFPRVEPGRYVSVVGSMRSTPVVHLSMSRVDLVDSADVVSYHRIECAHVALKLRREAEAQFETGGSGISRKSSPRGKKRKHSASSETPEATNRDDDLSPKSSREIGVCDRNDSQRERSVSDLIPALHRSGFSDAEIAQQVSVENSTYSKKQSASSLSSPVKNTLFARSQGYGDAQPATLLAVCAVRPLFI